MSIKNEYLKNVTGPVFEKDGVAQTRQPKLRLGSGFNITEDTVNNKLDISIDSDQLTGITQFTGSVNGVTIYNGVTPQYAREGTITSGSTVNMPVTLKLDTHFEAVARAIVRDENNNVLWTMSKNYLITYPSGSTAKIDYNLVGDNEYTAPNYTISSAINSNNDFVLSLTSGTGSYSYVMLFGGVEVEF